MEFFAELKNQEVTAQALREHLTIARLPELCSSIDTVLSAQSQDLGEIYCVWGQFHIARQEIRNGVRFSLLNCPHALAWTVTVHAESLTAGIHCTIDEREEQREFVESIEQFVTDWAKGLETLLRELA